MKIILILFLLLITFKAANSQQSLQVNRDQEKSDLQNKQNLPAENPANLIIEKAIQKKYQNDPELALESFKYKSYNKLIIDSESRKNQHTGRSFLSEKISSHLFKQPGFKRERIEGLKTAGFEDAVYDVLSLKLEPFSLYNDDYTIYETSYKAPLAKNALKKYRYELLDTTKTERPAYRIKFHSLRDWPVKGLEGILHIDTASFAIQQAFIQLDAQVTLNIEHSYQYYPETDIYFPEKIYLRLEPGTADMDISIFGGSITLGTVQRKNSLLDILLQPEALEQDLYLSSSTTFFDIHLNAPVDIDPYASRIKLLTDAHEKSVNYWAANRMEPFTIPDELTETRVRDIIISQDVTRKIELKKAITQGFYPIGSWDVDLGSFLRYNNYEGFRLGFGGSTNDNFLEKFRLQGYLAYGLKDEEFKYRIGGGIALNKRSGTWWNTSFTKDIREVASFNYLRGVNNFAILEPRVANISYYYKFEKLETGIQHRITPRFDAEVVLSRTDISQTRDYVYFNEGELYRDYIITEAKMGFLWRPFSEFISTPSSSHIIIDKKFPVVTGQITQGVENFLNGDFSFTKLGLKLDYGIQRLNRSFSIMTLEGNLGLGNLPLTHAFHSYPNNPNKETVLDRFSVAGNLSFETMYFNEFFSDRQLALHLKHQFHPIFITESIKPEIMLISRHVIGNMNNREVHRNISFKTLEHGFSEAGVEFNKLLAGFGLSFAYRYGAYHLPTFNENFSFKFTFQLSI